MKIKKIIIQNYRSIKEEEIIFPKSGILALVGPNNAGKSNILKAVDNILGDSWFSKDKCETNDYWMKNSKNNISIRIEFSDSSTAKIDFQDGGWPNYKNSFDKPVWSNDSKSYQKPKDVFPCTFLPANRDLAKNMQFRSYEIMGKIAKAFNSKIEEQTKINLKTKFNEIMSELDSIEGFSDFKKDFANYFNELQSDSPYKLKVDFKAFSPLNYFKTINILANDSSVSKEFDIDPVELGEGNKSLMLFALIRSYAKNFKHNATGILAVEEPEIYLHPQARRHLYQVFKEIVNGSNIQIIYTTHSPDFISTEEFSSIALVSKDSKEGTKVKITNEQSLVDFAVNSGVPVEKTNSSNIKEYYSTTSDSKLNEGFFAKHLILVEGDTEELCIPLLLERLGLNYYSSGISVIGVEGKNQIPKYWRLFKAFNLKLSVVFDSDSEGNKNIADCFDCDETTMFQNIDTIKKVETKSQNLLVFENDFETAFKKNFNNDVQWDVYEKEAIKLIQPIMRSGKPDQQKGQITRYITKRILAEYPDYKPTFIQVLIDEMELSNEPVLVTPIVEDDDFLPVEVQSVDYPPNVGDIPF